MDNFIVNSAPTSEDRYIDEMAEMAKRKAEQIRLASATGMNMDDHLLSLKYWWSSFYNRPMKDPLLEDYSLYDLYLEFYLHTFSKDAATSEMISDNREELEDLFKDFDAAPGKDFFAQDDEPSLASAINKEESSWSMSANDFQ